MDAFFAYARERHAIYLRRAAGAARPWSNDPIFQTNRFCNIYRELDRTTAWFRKYVRDPLKESPDVLLATVVFRWFNRITTGEAIFCQPDLIDGGSAFNHFLATGRVDCLKRAILELSPAGPYVTGSYTINTRSAGLGLSKLDGVLKLIEMWLADHPEWRDIAEQQLTDAGYPMEQFCTWATGPCLGPFMTYEIACDLRHTALLCHAPDLLTWANLGPGARRGLNRIFRPGARVDAAIPPGQALAEMGPLLQVSRDARYWPQWSKALGKVSMTPEMGWAPKGSVALWLDARESWPAWEMREVEHTLCEFDKYERVRLGQGRPRGAFNGLA